MPVDRTRSTSLAGPLPVLGALMLVYGVAALVTGGAGFGVADVPEGPVAGDAFLGLDGNGWTDVLWIGAGALLVLLGAPADRGAVAAGAFCGLVLGGLSVISLITRWSDDYWGAFGIFAANGWTTLVWGATALISFAGAMLATARIRHAGERTELPAFPGGDLPTDPHAVRAEDREYSGQR